MPGRTRTTKKLARRIDRDYIKRLFPMPRRRRIGWIAVTGAGMLWLAWYAFARNSAVYTAGTIKSSHATFGQQCGACHAAQGAFARKVTDQACESCHDGPIHQAQQISTPTCASCHMEHRGATQLSHTSARNCTACHSDLKTKTGQLRYAAHIDTFTDGHPEFAVLRNHVVDPGTIIFKHSVHLKKDLRGPKGNVQMQCADCHRGAAVAESWPYGQFGPRASDDILTVPQQRYVSANAYMGPINFYEHCSSCHPLAFDKRFNEAAPHKKPEVVEAFVLGKYTDYIAKHPGELRGPMGVQPQIAERPIPPYPRNAEMWIAARMREARTLLWDKSCKECHNLTYPAGQPVPSVQKAALTSRWFQNARFDHRAHQSVRCESCHDRAPKSESASDVLLPGIESCQQCHRPNQQASAGAECYECHDYHDWTKEKRIDGKYSIHQFMESSVETNGYQHMGEVLGSSARRNDGPFHSQPLGLPN